MKNSIGSDEDVRRITSPWRLHWILKSARSYWNIWRSSESSNDEEFRLSKLGIYQERTIGSHLVVRSIFKRFKTKSLTKLYRIIYCWKIWILDNCEQGYILQQLEQQQCLRNKNSTIRTYMDCSSQLPRVRYLFNHF